MARGAEGHALCGNGWVGNFAVVRGDELWDIDQYRCSCWFACQWANLVWANLVWANFICH